jgi:hypothetical protein
MDFNAYAVEMITAQRLAELRERGARLALLATERRARRSLSRPGRRGPDPGRALAGPEPAGPRPECRSAARVLR